VSGAGWRRATAGSTAAMADRNRVGMLLLHPGTPRDQEAREQLADALPDDAEVTEPDELGVFEVSLDADDLEEALQTVWDAVGASGTDDHLVFLEHPELPEHWRHRSASPQA
jgi:hypothetical protein